MQQQFFQTFTAYLDQSGQVVCQTWQGNQVIGMSLEKYREAEQMASDALAKAEDYRKKLVDAGLIQKELTPEEQISALNARVGELTTQLSAITEFLTKNQQQKEGGAE